MDGESVALESKSQLSYFGTGLCLYLMSEKDIPGGRIVDEQKSRFEDEEGGTG